MNDGIVAKIANHEFENPTSLALCLEDSISDDSMEKAEEQLKNILTALSKSSATLPLLFVRVKPADYLAKIHTLLGEVESILTGYILASVDKGIYNKTTKYGLPTY